MARPYIPDPEDATGADFTPWPVLDRSTEHSNRAETFVWPGAENDYTIRLDMAILEQVGCTLRDETDDVDLFIVRWRDNPGPDEVAVNFDRGLAKVHSSRVGNNGSALFKPLGFVADAQFFAELQQAASSPSLALDDLTDVDTTGATAGDILRWNETNWEAFGLPATAWGNIVGTLSDQTDLQGELDNLAADLGLKQDADSDLTAIAGLSSTGLIARTGSGTAAVRTITGTANEITVTNGNGVSGNPTLAAHANLARLATVQTWSAQQNFGRIGITGFVAGHREVQATGNITAADYRLGINVGANITLTLPLASSVEVGTTFEIYNLQTSASYNTTISTATGSDYLVWDTNVLNNFTFNRDITGVLVIQKYFTGAWAVIRCY